MTHSCCQYALTQKKFPQQTDNKFLQSDPQGMGFYENENHIMGFDCFASSLKSYLEQEFILYRSSKFNTINLAQISF